MDAADRRPVPSASLATATAPVPSASLASPAPLRQLHAGLRGFGVRDRGDLLVEPLPEWRGEGDDATWERAGLAVLDPTSGALRPFSTPWSPADLGWKLRRGSAPDHEPTTGALHLAAI